MGRLRGKRNRDQDRYWHERRKAVQDGMVGAPDVPPCVFCGALVPSDDAAPCDETVCRACGTERGLFQPLRVRSSEGLRVLTQIDALDYEAGHSKAQRASGHIAGASQITSKHLNGRSADRQQQSLARRLAREVETEVRRVARIKASLQRAIERGIERHLERAERRATRIAARQQEREVAARDREARRAARIAASLRSQVEHAIAVTLARESRQRDRDQRRVARESAYRQKWPRRKADVPRKLTDDEARAIREAYATGEPSMLVLGKHYGVSATHILLIVTGMVYKSAGGPIHIPVGRSSRIRGQRKTTRELSSTVRSLYESGYTLRAIARKTGYSRVTVRRLIGGMDLSVACPCGRPSGHRGWCPVRYARSEIRQAFIARWRSMRDEPKCIQK